MPHSKLSRTGKIVQETVQRPESSHKPLTSANLGRIELCSGLAHPVASDAPPNDSESCPPNPGETLEPEPNPTGTPQGVSNSCVASERLIKTVQLQWGRRA